MGWILDFIDHAAAWPGNFPPALVGASSFDPLCSTEDRESVRKRFRGKQIRIDKIRHRSLETAWSRHKLLAVTLSWRLVAAGVVYPRQPHRVSGRFTNRCVYRQIRSSRRSSVNGSTNTKTNANANLNCVQGHGTTDDVPEKTKDNQKSANMRSPFDRR